MDVPAFRFIRLNVRHGEEFALYQFNDGVTVEISKDVAWACSGPSRKENQREFQAIMAAKWLKNRPVIAQSSWSGYRYRCCE